MAARFVASATTEAPKAFFRPSYTHVCSLTLIHLCVLMSITQECAVFLKEGPKWKVTRRSS